MTFLGWVPTQARAPRDVAPLKHAHDGAATREHRELIDVLLRESLERLDEGVRAGGHHPCSDASRESEVVLTAFEDLLVSTDFDESLAPSLDVTVELSEKLRMSAFALLTIRAAARAARP